jgi:DNA-binding transcriptional LysR family regulator
MAAAVEAAQRSASGEVDEEQGTVRLTASDVIGGEVLPSILASFRVIWPGERDFSVDHRVEAFRGVVCGCTVIVCSSSSARCCAGFGVVVIWKFEPRLLPTRASMVENSARAHESCGPLIGF